MGGRPTISIETPAVDSFRTLITPLLLEGIASGDRPLVSVTWSNDGTGETGAAAGADAWSAQVPLARGVNLVTVTVLDRDGRSGEDSIAVTLVRAARGWGRNLEGQLGDGTGADASTPVAAVDPSGSTEPLDDVAALVAGDLHTAALLEDGTVLAWGWNLHGQLGDGTTIDRSIPVQVIDPSNPSGTLGDVIDLAASGRHSLALLGDGTVREWGLGIGESPTPVGDAFDPTGYLNGVVAIAAGERHGAALLADGSVRTWGDNSRGQLGDGTTIDSAAAIPVIDPADPSGYLGGVIEIAAGDRHTLAIRPGGEVLAWGENSWGQLGDGSTVNRTVPVRVVDPDAPSGRLGGAIGISGGLAHTIAVMADGTARAWGWNRDGQLGDGTILPSVRPVQVIDPSDPTGFLTGVTAVAGGAFHTVALIRDGTVRTWGENGFGGLGDGTGASRSIPALVIDPSDPAGFLSGVRGVDAGAGHTVARQ